MDVEESETLKKEEIQGDGDVEMKQEQVEENKEEITTENMEVETVESSEATSETAEEASKETGMQTTNVEEEEGTATDKDVVEKEVKEQSTDNTKEVKSSDKALVVPLSSPRIPSLGQGPKSDGAKVTKVSNREVFPSIPSTSTKIKVKEENDKESFGNLNQLLASTKSLSSALAKPNLIQEGIVPPQPLDPDNNDLKDIKEKDLKRKLKGGCSNTHCTTNSDDLVVANKTAMLYFQFNTVFKKVHKICVSCNEEASKYVSDCVAAIQNNENVFSFNPKPHGMDGDVIEVNEDEEEDSPRDLELLESFDKKMLELPPSTDLDELINGIMSRMDLRLQTELCEKSAFQEAEALEQSFNELEKQIASVEKEVIDTKLIYDKITGHYQSVPVITEELDITADGVITKKRPVNNHLDNSRLDSAIRARRSCNRISNYAEDSEIQEVELSQSRFRTSCPLAGPPKVIPRVTPTIGDIVYAQTRTLLHFWLKAEVVQIVEAGQHNKSLEFIVKFQKLAGGRQMKQVTAKQIAYNIPCPFILVVGTRILAKFRDELKTEPAGDGQYYAGIVAEPPSATNAFRYLVFFDDGYAQYVEYQDVLLVYDFSRDVWSDVYPDSADFIKNYIQKFPERPMVRMSLGQVITTEWNGKWWVARVIEIDCSLVKMKFENDGRCEWIYRGSTRLSPLFEKQSRQKTKRVARRTGGAYRNAPTIEYNYGDDMKEKRSAAAAANSGLSATANKPTARKSTGAHQVLEKEYGDIRRLARLDYGEFEGTIIKRPIPPNAPETKDFVEHECDCSCVYPYDETNKEYKKMSPLAIPLVLGFSREIAKNPRRYIFYRGPCGIRIRDPEEMYNYLTTTHCNIPIDHFCFDLSVDCLNEFRHSRQHSFLADLTYGKEAVPVQVVNAFDYEYPPYVEYSSSRIPGAGVSINIDDEFLAGCDCEDDCRDKSKCSCWRETFSGIAFTKLQSDEYPVRGYEYRRLRDHVASGIYECNSKCKCSKTCCNRVAQNGLKVPLQVFKTAAKGWGIRPLFDIPEGAFICIYAGQILTDAGANEDGKQFGDEYLAELDYIESVEAVKADYESDVTDIELEEPGEQSRRRKAKKEAEEKGDEEVDGHAGDSSYRGPKPTTLRTVGTRSKNGKRSSTSSKQSNSDSDEDGGAHTLSRFNPDVNTPKRKKKVERRPLREYFGMEEDCYIMDAKTTGNIGRYLNHSCQPNVFVQNVFVDSHDVRFPWVAFFASKHIRAGSELTWDYMYDIGSVPNKLLFCYCGSPDCRGRLL